MPVLFSQNWLIVIKACQKIDFAFENKQRENIYKQ